MVNVSVGFKFRDKATGRYRAAYADDAVQRALLSYGFLVVSYAQRLILKPPKTGAIYKRGSVSHQASAAGEAPASDTGRLVASGRFEPHGKASIKVIFGTEYASYLEFGTSRMAPRPFLGRAIEETKEQGRKLIAAEIEKL